MDMMMLRRAIINARNLPPEYQRVEYIESTGTQYIKITDTFYAGEVATLVCQATQTSATTIIAGYAHYGGRWFGTENGYYSIGVDKTFSNLETEKITAEIVFGSSLSATIDGVTLYRIASSTPVDLTLFAGNGTDNELAYYASAKIYSFKLGLRYNMVPCYRKADNEPGMYDMITNVFFSNNGSGTIRVGPEI